MRIASIWVSRDNFLCCFFLIVILHRHNLQINVANIPGWCHLAKTNMTGKQEPGGMWDKDIDYNRGGEMDMNENSTLNSSISQREQGWWMLCSNKQLQIYVSSSEKRRASLAKVAAGQSMSCSMHLILAFVLDKAGQEKGFHFLIPS